MKRNSATAWTFAVTLIVLVSGTEMPGHARDPAPQGANAAPGASQEPKQPEAKRPESPGGLPVPAQAGSPEFKGKAAEPDGAETTSHPPTSKKPVGSLILTTKLTLMADPQLLPYEIEVEASGGEVALSGRVASESDVLTALAVAQQVPGVTKVVNKLEVVKDLSRTLARKRDEIITRYVKERFARSKTLKAAGFDVKTEEGVVILSGKTRFQVIILEALEAAREVPGVKAVKTEGIHLEAGD